MKKSLFAAIFFLAVMAMACQNSGKGNSEPASKEKENEEEVIKQRVEQMTKMNADDDADKLLTADMFALQSKAQSVHYYADICYGFQWDLGMQDACSDNRGAVVEGVKLVDSLHCDVAMHYVDSTCYESNYTLKLLKENGEWRIDDVVYNAGHNTLREDCKDFYAYMVDAFATDDPKEIMEFIMGEEPLESHYTDPEFVYYNNPESLKDLIEDIKNLQEIFKKNPGYTEEYGKQIDEMIKRISSHI